MDSRRVLVVGRGAAGQALAQDLRGRGGTVVGFLDDRATGDDVLGTLGSVNSVVAEHSVDAVYFAIPSVDATTVRSFINTIDASHVEIAIIPRTYQILTKETVDIDDLTDVDVLDLVGRQPVKHDLVSSTEFIRGKRILVTGAAGSIGSRLVTQLAAMSPELLVCVDWWENGMFFLGQQLEGVDRVRLRVADVKNSVLMEQLFDECRPQVVFHAAAYKHVPLMQNNPVEAINNNVGGTLNVLNLSARHGVENVVYVSTDKAVNPVNVMGATKRIGELLMESIASESPHTRFNAVRFGNVIQSNGSVMQIFRGQIARKAPLTVTHADVTRFFMTIDEASQLIIQSAVIGRENEIFVLDMGEPVKILDLARSLVRAVNPSLKIEITGLRPGEKMYEELSYEPDKVERTANSKIFTLRERGGAESTKTVAGALELLKRAQSYSLSNEVAIESLRGLGFAVQ